MTTAWPMESKRLEALTQAVRYAKQRHADLRFSDPEDAFEWTVVADTISTEGGMIAGRDLWPVRVTAANSTCPCGCNGDPDDEP